MAQNEQHADDQRQESRFTISEGSWKDTVELTSEAIEFVIDLSEAGHLFFRDLLNFSHDVESIINTFFEFGDGGYEKKFIA